MNQSEFTLIGSVLIATAAHCGCKLGPWNGPLSDSVAFESNGEEGEEKGQERQEGQEAWGVVTCEYCLALVLLSHGIITTIEIVAS